MKILFYDPFAGISGDMNFGAMADLGIPEEYFRETLRALHLSGWDLSFRKDQRSGISGTKAVIKITNGNSEPHRHLKDIEQILNTSGLSGEIRSRSLAMFRIVAEAEAKVHGSAVDDVHFHEVGAVDSIIDIVAAAAAVAYLKPDKIISRPPELGSGTVRCAHGILPVPAPATAEILRGIPCTAGRVPSEATTPTGAAILKASVDEFSESGSMTIEKTGYGIGERDSDVPNVLRIFLAEGGTRETIEGDAAVIECNIDDMNPELYDYVSAMLFRAGAKDVFLTPVQMKKNRPGSLFTVITGPEKAQEMIRIIFRETTTAGVRRFPVKRTMLRREIVSRETPYGPVRVKELYLGGECISRKPEYEDLKSIALKEEIPLRRLYEQMRTGDEGSGA